MDNTSDHCETGKVTQHPSTRGCLAVVLSLKGLLMWVKMFTFKWVLNKFSTIVSSLWTVNCFVGMCYLCDAVLFVETKIFHLASYFMKVVERLCVFLRLDDVRVIKWHIFVPPVRSYNSADWRWHLMLSQPQIKVVLNLEKEKKVKRRQIFHGYSIFLSFSEAQKWLLLSYGKRGRSSKY